MTAILETDPQLQWASYSDEATGRFAGANRLPHDQVVLNVSDPGIAHGVPREFQLDGRTPHVRSPPLTEPYEPRTRPFYRRAAAQPGVVVWMPTYVFAEGIKGITAALAIPATDPGRVRGVTTVDFALTGITRYLEALNVGRRIAVLVFESNGALLAGAPGPGQEAATRAVDLWARGAAGGQLRRGTRSADVEVDGTLWVVSARSITSGAGLDWIVAAAVPDEEFMGPVHANQRAAILIAVAGLTAAVLAAIGLSTGIVRSLRGASGALDRVARFDLAEPAQTPSVLREVAQLQGAVSRVRASLRSFSRYAPEEIVRDVVVSGREAMLSGERRDVTVLFSDLRGFSATAGRLPPEDVVEILNDHFDQLVAIVVRHHGFVVDFLGDAVFAVFGAPRADARHAERAVQCAMEMQAARTARNGAHRARGWPPLEMGVGLNTGPAVVGNMGSRQRIKYGVVGHVVNVAARIETLTVGGQVLVADATREALTDRLEADGPLEAEGKGAGALRVWDVRGLRTDDALLTLRPPIGDLAVLDPPLVAEIRLVLGKQVDHRAYAARVVRLGASGADLESDAPWATFSAVHVVLPAARAGEHLLGLDAKVVALPVGERGRRAVVRFTGADWETQARVEALARWAPAA
jgi:class 3 adenylate cyclase